MFFKPISVTETCSSSYSTSTTKVSCFLKGKELENCIEPVEGTLAKYECATYYEDPQLAKNPINICLNGFWDQRQPNCVPGNYTLDVLNKSLGH
jgi:hypothetical protein